jgi:hypothetical protein
LTIDRDNLKHAFRTLTGIGDQSFEEDDNIFVYKGEQWAGRPRLAQRPAQNRAGLETAAKITALRM